MSVNATCEWCGNEFVRPHCRGPRPKYCSESHRQQAYRARQLGRFAEGLQSDTTKEREAAARSFLGGVALPGEEPAKAVQGIGAQFSHAFAGEELAKAVQGIGAQFSHSFAGEELAKAVQGLAFSESSAFAEMLRAISGSVLHDGRLETLEPEGLASAGSNANLEALVSAIVALALVLLLRKQFDAIAGALAEATASQLAFMVGLAAQISDQSPEVRGALTIMDAGALIAVVWKVATWLTSRPLAGSTKLSSEKEVPSREQDQLAMGSTPLVTSEECCHP